jgi:hypothetical protein
MKDCPYVSSKLLDKRWKIRDHEIHKQRLREVKSSVRVHQTPPYILNPAIKNIKKEAMLESRNTFLSESI